MTSAASRLCPVCHTFTPCDSGSCPGCAYAFPAADGLGAPSEPSEALEAGTLIGDRYEVLATLGQGGMGVVYRASDHQLASEVAIKLVLPTLVSTPEIVSRFVTEARRARELTHENIVRVYNLEIFDGTPVIAMELLEGEDLKARVLAGPLAVHETIEIGLQVCAGMAYAHSHGFVHRDIKPQNLFVTRDRRVKILDFGIAKALGEEASAGMTLATRTGVIVGTPAYMPPEQAAPKNDVPVDPRSDIYSLGVVLYQCLTGQLPFSGQSPVEVAIKQVTETPPPLRALRPELPVELEGIVLKSLAKDRDERHQNMDELAADLRWFRDERLQTAKHRLRDRLRPPDPPSGGFRRARRRPRWWPIALAATVVVSAGVLALLAGPQLIDFFGRTPRQQAASFTGIAEVNEEAGRLLPPQGDNAYEEYMRALRADASYERAREGLDRILDSHLESEVEDLATLDRQVTSFEPGRPMAKIAGPVIRAALADAESEVATLRELFFERDEITQLASELEILRRRWERREALDQRLDETIRLMEAGAWTKPPGANAYEMLGRVQLDYPTESESPGVQAAREQLSTELVRAARLSEESEEVFAALAMVTLARDLDPSNDELQQWHDALALERDRRVANRERAESASKLVTAASDRISEGALVQPAGNNARELFELALEKDPGSAPARAGLGRVRDALLAAGREALEGGRTEEALERFEAARGLPDWESEVGPSISRARASLDDERLRKRRIAEAEEILARAERLAQRGSLAEPPDFNAAGLYRELIESHPEVADRARLGLRHVGERLSTLALEARSDRQHPLELAYLQQLASIEPASGERSRRIEELRAQIATQNRELDRNKRIEALLETGKPAQLAARRWTVPPGDNAVASYRQVLELEPRQSEASAGLLEIGKRLSEQGEAAFDRGDLEGARIAFRKATELGAEGAGTRLSAVEARWAEARARAERERDLEARALAERQSIRASASALVARSREALGQEDLREAVAFAETATELDASTPGLPELEQELLDALMRSAKAASNGGRIPQAREILALAPRIAASGAGTSALAARMDQWSRALTETESAEGELARGDIAKASAGLGRARRLAPELSATSRLEVDLVREIQRRIATLECAGIANARREVTAVRAARPNLAELDSAAAAIDAVERDCSAPPPPFIPPP